MSQDFDEICWILPIADALQPICDWGIIQKTDRNVTGVAGTANGAVHFGMILAVLEMIAFQTELFSLIGLSTDMARGLFIVWA